MKGLLKKGITLLALSTMLFFPYETFADSHVPKSSIEHPNKAQTRLESPKQKERKSEGFPKDFRYSFFNGLENIESKLKEEEHELSLGGGNYNKELHRIRKKAALRTGGHALGYAAKFTPVGKWAYGKWEDVRIYLRAGGAKDKGGEWTFFRPGQLTKEKLGEKRDYKFSLTSSIMPRYGSDKPDFALGVRGNVLEVSADVLYNPKDESLLFSIGGEHDWFGR